MIKDNIICFSGTLLTYFSQQYYADTVQFPVTFK